MGAGKSKLTPGPADEGRVIPPIEINKPFKVTINPFATLICLLYLASAAYYFYIRITVTLTLGDYRWYSIFILAVEFLGISALLPYALMIVRTVLTNRTPGLKAGDAGDPAQHPWFTVHVLVPCYSESVDVIAKTVDAALKAPLPPNCMKKVYLCDDGKREVNQTFCQTKRRNDLIYVSGRSRKPGEKNGKSANLNNCLQNHIFAAYKHNGEFTRQAAMDIPLSDVVVVFDCDMVCKPNFFLKILEVMADDNLALCLTPQGFDNINPNIDLFNNINLQFWEYILPGSVAAGYIACTGTNFCIRARALAYVGWFPEYTITEDYALGMELAQNGFKGSYLNEYLAIGEAPDEIRNVMRQRSRWTKGHMEVFFSKRCPLFNWRLSCVNRILYTNGTWAYFVTVITTPIFLLVPLVSLVFGIHPVAVTRPFAIAAVIYFFCTFLLQWYCRNIMHAKSLWFSNISNHVLCFTYFKAISNTLLSICGCKPAGGFKVTKKKEEKKSALQKALEQMAQKTRTMARTLTRTLSRRPSNEPLSAKAPPMPGLPPPGNSDEPEPEDDSGCCSWWCANAGDLENTLDSTALFISWAISATAIAIGIYQAVLLGTFEVYTMLPIFWAAYNIVAPTLFLWYLFTKGPSFAALCGVMRLFGMLAGIGALVSLWFSPQAEIDMRAMNTRVAAFLSANQAGQIEPGAAAQASWLTPTGLRDGLGTFDWNPPQPRGVDLSGGFYVDGGSLVKYNHPMGVAVSMLAWGFIEFRKGVEQGGQEEQYFSFFRHAGDYFMKLWLRDTNEYVVRVGDPEVDGRFMGVPPKDLDNRVDMQRPVFTVAQKGDTVVYGMDAIAQGVAALAAAGVVLAGGPGPDDSARALLYRNTAFEMWHTLVEGNAQREVTGQSYCQDHVVNGTRCLSTPVNITNCFTFWANSTAVDRTNPPPAFAPPPPDREFLDRDPAGRRRRVQEHEEKENGGVLSRLLKQWQMPTGRRGLRQGGRPSTIQLPIEVLLQPPNSPPFPPWPPQPPSPPFSPAPPQPFLCNWTVDYTKQDNFYNSTSVYDDAAWAASWLFRAAEIDGGGDGRSPREYLDRVDFWLDKHYDYEGSWNNATYYITNWNNMQWATALMQVQNLRRLNIPLKESGSQNASCTYFRAWLARGGLRTEDRKPFPNMEGFEMSVVATTAGGYTIANDCGWGCFARGQTTNYSMGHTATTAMMAMQFSKMTTNRFTSKRLRCWSRQQLRFMLGYPQKVKGRTIKELFQPVKGQSYVVGFGENYPKRVADRAAACPAEQTCGPTTWASSAPNPATLNGALVSGPDLQQNWLDVRTNPGNRVGLLNNMGFNGLVSAFNDPEVTIDAASCQEDQGLWDTTVNKVDFEARCIGSN